MTTRFGTGWFCWLALLGMVPVAAAEPPRENFSPTAAQAVLVNAMQHHGEWTSVHAAEYLIQAGRGHLVPSVFRPQADTATAPFRIGVWRVLAQAEETAAERTRYVEQIRAALLDTNGPDQLHALESLAKLNIPLASEEERALVRELASNDEYAGQAFALWRLEQEASSPERSNKLVAVLRSADPVRRLRAAFVLGQHGSHPPEIRAAIGTTLAHEPHDSIAYPYLAIAAGGEPLLALAHDADHPSAQALAVRELALQGQTLPALKISADSPLALKMVAAFARLRAGDKP